MASTKNDRFQTIYTENFKVVRLVLGKFPTLQNDIDDIMHDVFIKFFDHMEGIPAGKERAYLIVSARNAALDRIRQQKFRKTDLTAETHEEAHQPLWESDTAHELRIGVVGRLLDEIADQERGGEHFRQFYRDGMSLKEIAARSGVPLGTVAARVARLRDKLKSRLREHLET